MVGKIGSLYGKKKRTSSYFCIYLFDLKPRKGKKKTLDPKQTT